MKDITKTDSAIVIFSGEGERGTVELYTGVRSIRAIKSRLTRERCGGDRWARAFIFAGLDLAGGQIFEDLETGEIRNLNIEVAL